MEQEKIVLCDTDIIIEFYRNNPEIISELKSIGQNNIAISTITAGELIYGALNKKELNQIRKDINNLFVLEINKKICDIFLEIMMKYAPRWRGRVVRAFLTSNSLSVVYDPEHAHPTNLLDLQNLWQN